MQHKIKKVVISSEQTVQQNHLCKKTIRYILKVFNSITCNRVSLMKDVKIRISTFPTDRYMNMIRLL